MKGQNTEYRITELEVFWFQPLPKQETLYRKAIFIEDMWNGLEGQKEEPLPRQALEMETLSPGQENNRTLLPRDKIQ